MRLILPALLLSTLAMAVDVESFSPQGAVSNVRQAKARFSSAMVKFGDPRLANPFDVACGEEQGSGRWVDDRNWVYDFNRDLPAATQCTFTPRRGTKGLDGTALTASAFTFTTGGPEPSQTWPSDGMAIAEDQVFMVSFAARPAAASLKAKARCEVDGIAERIPAVSLPPADRDKLFAGYFGRDSKRWPTNLEALRCQRPLPNDVGMRLVFDAGLATDSGAALREPMRMEFRVRAKFNAWLSCERTRTNGACVPITPITLRFSEAITDADAKAVVLSTLDGKQRWQGEAVRGEEGTLGEDANGKASKLVDGVTFKGPFPEKVTLRLTVPAGLRDTYGRALSGNAFPMNVPVDAFPPLAKFSASFGIVERDVGVLPVAVRNVAEQGAADSGVLGKLVDLAKTATGAAKDSKGLPYRALNLTRDADIIKWHQLLNRGPQATAGQDYRSGSLLKNIPDAKLQQLPAPADDRAAEVIGMPLPKSGLTVVEVESKRLGARLFDKPASMFVASGGLVTNLTVHFRRGIDDALVWVTTLDKGWLVNGAAVTVYDCKGKSIASGKTDKQGVWYSAKPLPAQRYDCPLYVMARQGDDVSFVVDSWREGIEPWRFGLSTEHDRRERQTFHAVLDRGLYRAGETVSMKLLAREKTATGFGLLADNQLPTAVRLTHLGSDDSVALPLKWQGGAAEASWKVPAEAKLGQYAISVERGKGKNLQSLGEAGNFAVAEFRVPLMRGVLKLPADVVAASSMQAVAQVQYLAGGPAAGTAVKLRGIASPGGARSLPAFPDFSFSTGDVSAAVLKGGGMDDELADDSEPDSTQALENLTATLDKAGAATLKLGGWRTLTEPMRVYAELEFNDPNGEVQTSGASATLWPAALQAGIHVGTVKAGAPIPIELGVAGIDGKPLAGRNVKAEAWLEQTFSHRKRLVGGFYSYQHETRYLPLGEICKGRTDGKGRLACNWTPSQRGRVTVRVTAADDAGRVSLASTDIWMSSDGGDDWEAMHDGDRIDLIADKKQYEPGEVANLRVAMPFRDATALIAVEREKVLTWQTQVLSAANPVVRIPIQPTYGPNVFVSVLVVRGRVAGPEATALVDLAKPAYKLGIAKLVVGGKHYGLDVKVAADKPIYQTRDTATVKVAVRAQDGSALPAGSEVALAAVDEGLLQLRPNESWHALRAMLGDRPYGFFTATSQGQVVGKRHFGRKAVPVGGGGGRSSTRELFDTLLLWKARVTLDAKGEATVPVPLNDSLTSFRIVAIATAGSDRFGTGETSIKATKDVMLFSGLARTVRQDDKFDATFTVRNATDKPVSLSVAPKADGLPAMSAQHVQLAGGEARELVWSVNVPAQAKQVAWVVTATGDDGRVFDKLAVKQAVIEAVPVRVLQATLAQLAPDYKLPLARPKDALAGRGGVRVTLSPSLVSALDGVEDYLRRYPYTCLEQQTSRAIGLNDEKAWNQVMGKLDSYLDSEGFAKFFPSMERGSPALTAHLLRLAASSGWSIPDKGLARMQAALTAYVEGRSRFERPWDSSLRAANRLDALAALAPYGATRPSQLDGLVIEPNRWPTSAVIDWAIVLDAMTDAPKRDARRREAQQILLSRLDLSGTTLNFSPVAADDWAWLDTNDSTAARLLLLQLAQTNGPIDLGRLARGVVGRQQRGHWDTTVANAWGALALRQFAAKVEAGKPAGGVVATLGEQKRLDWAGKPDGGSLDFAWPAGDDALTLRQDGAGKPWAIVQARAALPLTAPLNAGYRVDKRWEPVEAAGKGYARGDVWRVRLTIDAQADSTWVVVDDPIPAGAQLLGRGLANDSALLSRKEAGEGAWPAFEEKGETAYHAYYEWMPKGRTEIEYTVRLNARGEFRLPPTHIEAMYAPERFGDTPNANLRVD
jgi:hypothetical protein